MRDIRVAGAAGAFGAVRAVRAVGAVRAAGAIEAAVAAVAAGAVVAVYAIDAIYQAIKCSLSTLDRSEIFNAAFIPAIISNPVHLSLPLFKATAFHAAPVFLSAETARSRR